MTRLYTLHALLACLLLACLQLTLYNKAGDKVAALESLESGGLTEDFEVFYFTEPAMGCKIRIDLQGTTAGLWNAITEVCSLFPSRIITEGACHDWGRAFMATTNPHRRGSHSAKRLVSIVEL